MIPSIQRKSRNNFRFSTGNATYDSYLVRINNHWNINRICFQVYFQKTTTFDSKNFYYIINRQSVNTMFNLLEFKIEHFEKNYKMCLKHLCSSISNHKMILNVCTPLLSDRTDNSTSWNNCLEGIRICNWNVLGSNCFLSRTRSWKDVLPSGIFNLTSWL